MGPTPEQDMARAVFTTNESMAVSAYAGTGKTTLLRMLALDAQRNGRRGGYVAFNKAIVEEAAGKFPTNVAAQTAHKLAWQAVVRGTQFRGRLDGRRVRGSQIARQLGIDPFVIKYGDQSKVLQPGFVASLAQRAIEAFCSTADVVPSYLHVPYVDGIDLPRPSGERSYDNNDRLAATVATFLPGMWADLTDPGGTLPFKHSHYLKMFELSRPRLGWDFVLFDEAQDVTPVMRSIVEQQADYGTQVVYVGDPYQEIYTWTGAVNAIASANVDYRSSLTLSFRFGEAIAHAANRILLVKLGADEPIVGSPGIASRLGPLSDPDALLCRTNALAMEEVLAAQRQGLKPMLMGGGKEILAFAAAAQELIDKGTTSHFDLACFDSWTQVLEYVANDPQGDELALNVRLIEEFGIPTIVSALGAAMPKDARDADLVIATAHKCKGLEWDRVKLGRDFAFKEGMTDMPAAEWRLLYVACTRARLVLDVTASAPMCELLDVDDEVLA